MEFFLFFFSISQKKFIESIYSSLHRISATFRIFVRYVRFSKKNSGVKKKKKYVENALVVVVKW